MFRKFVNFVKGWWNNMLDYNKIVRDFELDSQTSDIMLKAIQTWTNIFNCNEPWIDKNTMSLHVAKTICEKVSKAVTIEYKSVCSDEYINGIYQKFLRKIRTYTEYMIGKSSIFFRPYYSNGKIKISVIQAGKFIPIKFSDDGDLLGVVLIDQFTVGKKIYTRLEYDNLTDKGMSFKNIAYEGNIDGQVLDRKIPLSSVEKWKELSNEGIIEGVDRIIGGFATMPNANTIDNSSPMGQSIFHNAIGTLEQIDKQFSRTIWEYEGSELAIDIDESLISYDENGNLKYPKGKERLYRKLVFDEVKDNNYNIFSPEIRDTSLFNGLNELLRQAESECQLAFGTISKIETIAKTATEIKTSKQDYYVTVSDIQGVMENALNDLIYGIYVLCRLYNLPVDVDYTVRHDWDDSILVDKESMQKTSMIELQSDTIDKVQYFIETRGYTEEEAIEFCKRMNERKKIIGEIEQEEDLEE